MNEFRVLLTIAVVICAPLPARALCTYNGVDNVKTTVGQEFKDSKWVVKAAVVSAADHWSDVADSWVTYEIRVKHAYKGHPPERLRFFSYRDSGGFYMDRPWVGLPAGHDIGGEYLLFLDPIRSHRGRPIAAKGAVFVNYNCGQSRPWPAVPSSVRNELAALEHAD
ncbi:MAG TPA: hypothetical protein VMT68_17815 [Caulobacteraceae bacterium]|nr:hypothetical protein [Caulobacteraceae bacterium]